MRGALPCAALRCAVLRCTAWSWCAVLCCAALRYAVLCVGATTFTHAAGTRLWRVGRRCFLRHAAVALTAPLLLESKLTANCLPSLPHEQDVACAECPLHGSEEALGGTPAALFCVFDGHCGRAAAEAASTALPDEVSKRLAGEWFTPPLFVAGGS